MRIAIYLSVLLSFALGCSTSEDDPSPSDTEADSGIPPNIILIISDDHYWGDHGFMGNPVVQTPHIDRLASESMLFTRGYTPTSVCRPSLATMVTGRYPHQHGITGNDPPGGASTIGDPAARAKMVEVFQRNETVIELLQSEGYLSHQSGKWWEGDPTDHGFTEGMTHGDVTRGGRHGDEGLKIGREGMQPIKDFIDAAGDQPFMVYYAPFLPHLPHNPPDSLFSRYEASGLPDQVAKYYAMIEWLDLTVGELFAYLDTKGLRERTVVLYAVDNGWLPVEENQGRFDSRAKMSPYDAGMRTPIMIRWPGAVEPGRDEKTFVSTLDMVPTILSAVGKESPPDLPGIDLRKHEALVEREFIFGELFAHTAVDAQNPVANLKYRYAISQDGWKLILPYTPNQNVELMLGGVTSEWMRFDPELYNVFQDPRELQNLAESRPGLVDTLRSQIDEWWSVSQ